jgi:hypothetical protein
MYNKLCNKQDVELFCSSRSSLQKGQGSPIEFKDIQTIWSHQVLFYGNIFIFYPIL